MKPEEMVEIGSYLKPGFEMIACGGEWKASVLNEASIFFPENLSYVERHFETDEVFLLLEGKARLFAAGNGETPDETPYVIEMKPLTAYNVKANVWHAVENHPGTKILVIEKTDTGSHNTVHFDYPHF